MSGTQRRRSAVQQPALASINREITSVELLHHQLEAAWTLRRANHHLLNDEIFIKSMIVLLFNLLLPFLGEDPVLAQHLVASLCLRQSFI